MALTGIVAPGYNSPLARGACARINAAGRLVAAPGHPRQRVACFPAFSLGCLTHQEGVAMCPSARAAKKLAAICGVLLLAGVAPAGPLVQTAPYNVTFNDGYKYRISGKVETGGAGFIYTYKVQLLTKDVAASRFELGIAEDPLHAGLHDETNAKVVSGPGQLMYDLQPHVSTPSSTLHNYVFTALSGNTRVGISISSGQVQVLSFEDPNGPSFANWDLRQISPGNLIALSSSHSLGELPVPGTSDGVQRSPEPSTLTLAVLGIVGAGLSFRRRRNASTSAKA